MKNYILFEKSLILVSGIVFISLGIYLGIITSNHAWNILLSILGGANLGVAVARFKHDKR